MRLDGKKILVVGVGPGLGAAATFLLLKDGAEVAMVARNGDKLKALQEKLSKYGKVLYISGDASTKEGAKRIADEAVQKLGSIDGMVLTVGTYANTPIDSIEEKEVELLLNTNVKAPLYLVSAAARYIQNGGAIVMVSSVFGTHPIAPVGTIAYSAAKAGVAKATEVIATELLDRGIRVNTVAPLSMSFDFEPERDWRKSRRLGSTECPPEDVASVIVWLMTREAEWVNGAVIPVDGGARLKYRLLEDRS